MQPVTLFVLSVLLGSTDPAQGGAGEGEGTGGRRVYVARMEDEAITPGTARYLQRAIRQAEETNAECLVIVLDTPGGLLVSTRRIVKRILAARTCVVVYVAPSGGRAASAGVFITLASHVAAMSPGTTIGAAHPVQVGGMPFQPSPTGPEGEGETRDSEQSEGSRDTTPLEEKIVSDTVAWARSLAERRERNSTWAERAVSESLTLTASEALDEGVVELVTSDLEDLFTELDGREVSLRDGERTVRTSGTEVHEVTMWWGERLLALISQPNVAFLLMIFGFYGILFELYSPGWGVPGTFGIICLLLAFFGLAVLPVDYLGLALVIVALGLYVSEVFVPSFGMLTVAGTVCLVLGGVMLVDSPEGFGRVSAGVVVPVALATALITLFLAWRIVRAHRGRVLMGGESLAGIEARAREDFVAEDDLYAGMVRAHGELWKAVSTVPVKSGERCRIDSRQGLTVFVTPAENARPSAAQTPPGERSS